MQEFLKRLMPSGFPSQRCPECDQVITSDDINIKEGVALCPGCGKLSRLSELNSSGRSIAEILAQPPAGCSVVSDGHRLRATVSLRSLAGFVIPAGFALFWNSITSIFVRTAIAGLYSNLIGPLPTWFPLPGLKEGKPEMDGAPMDLGMSLFLCVFLIPFVTIGLGMALVALMNLMGKLEVVIDEWDSYAATGIGFVRWKKRFNPREVHEVELGAASWQSDGGSNKLIELRGVRTVKFGSLLQLERLEWLRAVLRQTLLPQNGVSRLSTIPDLVWLTRKLP